MGETKLGSMSTKSELAPVEQWITDEDLDAIYSSSFWNDVEVERKNFGLLMVTMVAVRTI